MEERGDEKKNGFGDFFIHGDSGPTRPNSEIIERPKPFIIGHKFRIFSEHMASAYKKKEGKDITLEYRKRAILDGNKYPQVQKVMLHHFSL